MDPVAFSLFGRPVYWYGVFFALGFLAASVHWTLAARRRGYPAHFGSDLGLWIILGGVLGARLAFVAANWPEYRAAPLTILRIDQGGLIYYGGFLGGIAAVVLFAARHRTSPWAVGDLAASGLPLGHAFGRIGCLLNSCCYGTACTLPWATDVQGTARHPVQVYEALANLAIFAVLAWRMHRKQDPPGRVFALYLLLYPPMRFLFEFLRGDPRAMLTGLTQAQVLSLALFVAGAVLWRWSGKAGRDATPSAP